MRACRLANADGDEDVEPRLDGGVEELGKFVAA
jgi:hypothetical protein